MNTRLLHNRNETRYCNPTYRGLHVIDHRGPLVEKYLEMTFRTLECALGQYPKTFATRFELLFPKHTDNWSSEVISKFTEALKADINAFLRIRGEKPEKCKPRLIWAKERNKSSNSHYHVVLLLNKDVFFTSGKVVSKNYNMAKRIEAAWAKALGFKFERVPGLVNFPKNRDYIVNTGDKDFLQQLTNLFYRASYLAKEDTKEYCDGSRHFSCSHLTSLPASFSLSEVIQYHKGIVYGMPLDHYLKSNEIKRGLQ